MPPLAPTDTRPGEYNHCTVFSAAAGVAKLRAGAPQPARSRTCAPGASEGSATDVLVELPHPEPAQPGPPQLDGSGCTERPGQPERPLQLSPPKPPSWPQLHAVCVVPQTGAPQPRPGPPQPGPPQPGPLQPVALTLLMGSLQPRPPQPGPPGRPQGLLRSRRHGPHG
jgi:hypothetical protein